MIQPFFFLLSIPSFVPHCRTCRIELAHASLTKPGIEQRPFRTCPVACLNLVWRTYNLHVVIVRPMLTNQLARIMGVSCYIT